jgi:hypothetical protein
VRLRFEIFLHAVLCGCVGERVAFIFRFSTSDQFSFYLHESTVIHGYSCAAELAKAGKKEIRASDVPAGCWLRDFSPDGRENVTGDAIASSSFGGALSLVWIHDAI